MTKVTLNDDVMCVIIALCEYEEVITLQIASKTMYKLVHRIRKLIHTTNNIYDACRNNNVISFKQLLPVSKDVIPSAIQLTTSVEILNHASATLADHPYITFVHTAMLRNNIVAPLPTGDMQAELIEFLVYTRNHTMLTLFPRNVANMIAGIYAVTSQYEYVMEYIQRPCMMHVLACAAYVSGDERIINLVSKEVYNGVCTSDDIHIISILATFSIIANNIDVFMQVLPHVKEHSLTLLDLIIHYNRVDFIYRTAITRHITSISRRKGSILRMTHEMAIAIVECMREHNAIGIAFKLIISARNYDLIWLINTYYGACIDLTRKSTHEDYKAYLFVKTDC